MNFNRVGALMGVLILRRRDIEAFMAVFGLMRVIAAKSMIVAVES